MDALVLFAVTLAAGFPQTTSPGSGQATPTVLRFGHLWDGTRTMDNATVVVLGTKIVSAGTVRVTVPKYEPRAEPAPTRPAAAVTKGKRRIHFGATQSVEATLYERDKLDIGATIAGPAIVEQFDATTVVPHAWTGRVDGYRNLILERKM